jgi:hypothetical protein
MGCDADATSLSGVAAFTTSAMEPLRSLKREPTRTSKRSGVGATVGDCRRAQAVSWSGNARDVRAADGQQQGERLTGKGTWVGGLVGDIVGRRDGACRHPRLLSDGFGGIGHQKPYSCRR